MTPVGSAPVSLNPEVGTPSVVTVKVPATPTVNETLFALVMAGAFPMVTVGSDPARGSGPV